MDRKDFTDDEFAAYEAIVGPAPQPDKAIAIAQDALDRLDARQHHRGVYLSGTLYRHPNTDIAKDAGECLMEIEANCRVCLLGALFLSKANKYDEVPMHELIVDELQSQEGRNRLWLHPTSTSVNKHLVSYFGQAQLRLLESWFEMGICGGASASSIIDEISRYCHGAAEEGSLYRNDNKVRVKIALENFIANEGRLLVKPVDAFDDSVGDVEE